MRRLKNEMGSFFAKVVLRKKGLILCTKLLKIILFAELFAFLFDLCPQPYCHRWIENIFEHETSTGATVVAIAWTVASIPLSFLLGQSEQRRYGIRLIDLLIAALEIQGLLLLLSSLCIQLALILMSVTYNLSILFTVVSWAQIKFLILALYIVSLSLSKEVIQNIIEDQSIEIKEELMRMWKYDSDTLYSTDLKTLNENIKHFKEEFTKLKRRRHWLLEDVIKQLNYQNNVDVEILESILVADQCLNLNNLIGQKIAYDIFSTMLTVAGQDVVNKISYQLYTKLNSYSQKGILGALISERTPAAYEQCQFLIKLLKPEGDDKKENIVDLYRWGILWGENQRLFTTKPDELLENEIFISQFKSLMKQNCALPSTFDVSQFNKSFSQICIDTWLLISKADTDFERIANNMLQKKILNLFGGNQP